MDWIVMAIFVMWGLLITLLGFTIWDGKIVRRK